MSQAGLMKGARDSLGVLRHLTETIPGFVTSGLTDSGNSRIIGLVYLRLNFLQATA
jgi:hypothetical protein